MQQRYSFKDVETKWQARWEKSGAFKAVDFSDKPKFYVLSEFFGPSGKGIHLGHVKCFTPTEVVARYMRLKGYNVLYPVGWDAFGLPTENYALKMNLKPVDVTRANVQIFTNQLKRMGYSFDWSREICTTDEGYYRHTQQIFLDLYNHGLAYKAEGLVNFCPDCQTVLSNEDSQGGICDRCKAEVVQKTRSVWYLKMKDYSDKMLQAIDEIDMKENLKDAQRNWIGRSTGAEIEFAVKQTKQTIRVYTTRPDTVYGVTFMVLSPEHPLVGELKTQIKNLDEVTAYANEAAKKSAIMRAADKQKTGVKLEGVFAINPANGSEIPVFIADYVMMGYGTGAIMAVPAHDERDYAFAKAYNIPIIEVISGGDIATEAYAGDGKLINSGILNGMDVESAKERMIAHLEQTKTGTRRVNYKMQDWPFNRQRYWGEPFPIVFCEHCGTVPLSADDLPLTLPETDDIRPDASGNGPLSNVGEFVSCTCPKCGKPAKRETDTMPNWAGSSWYWLRFTDPHNDQTFASKENLAYWGAVDLYTGGTEHVTRHMLYASFWHNFLCDIGKVPHRLPFARRMCNGLILDENGKKMGKSSGNAVDPLSVIEEYGADAFRLHVLFMGDYEQNTVWTMEGINGCTNFLNRVWGLPDLLKGDAVSKEHERALHLMLKRADTGILCREPSANGEHNDFKFNTVIAGMMEYLNLIRKDGYLSKEELRVFLIVLNPFAPHITSELYEQVFGGDITNETFPVFDERKLLTDTIEMPIQINGKLKGRVTLPADADEQTAAAAALKELNLTDTPKKIIFVPGRILNLIL